MLIASDSDGSPIEHVAWAAILRVRSAIDRRELVIQTMQEYLRGIRGPDGRLAIGVHAACYRHESIKTDATLALLFEQCPASDDVRAQLDEIASLLKHFGQVDLSIWINVHPNKELP